MVRVFISYTHDSEEHRDCVWALANELRGSGVDCRIDRYEENPTPEWMRDQILEADFVLVVCTEPYYRRSLDQEKEGKGRGSKWEYRYIRRDLYQRDGKSQKYIPIFLGPSNNEFIPVELHGDTYYQPQKPAGYQGLLRRLLGQPEVQMPALGAEPTLAPAQPPTLFGALEEKGKPAFGPEMNTLLLFEARDETWAERLRLHLAPLEGTVVLYEPSEHDLQHSAGTMLDQAKVALFLITPAFFGNAHLKGFLAAVIERVEKGAQGPRLFWVPVRPAAYTTLGLSDYSPQGDASKPLATLKDWAVDGKMVEIARAVGHALRA